VRRIFLRTLAVTAVLQFVLTRARAGRVEEEGAAEMMWVLYPFNVVLNAAAWTLLIASVGGVVRVLRRA
jgi:hypothetical protein